MQLEFFGRKPRTFLDRSFWLKTRDELEQTIFDANGFLSTHFARLLGFEPEGVLVSMEWDNQWQRRIFYDERAFRFSGAQVNDPIAIHIGKKNGKTMIAVELAPLV